MTELVTKQDLDVRLRGVEAQMQNHGPRLEGRIEASSFASWCALAA